LPVALIQAQIGKNLFVMKYGMANQVMVNTGARTDEYALRSLGIQTGGNVLASALMYLQNGSKPQYNLQYSRENEFKYHIDYATCPDDSHELDPDSFWNHLIYVLGGP